MGRAAPVVTRAVDTGGRNESDVVAMAACAGGDGEVHAGHHYVALCIGDFEGGDSCSDGCDLQLANELLILVASSVDGRIAQQVYACAA